MNEKSIEDMCFDYLIIQAKYHFTPEERETMEYFWCLVEDGLLEKELQEVT